MKLTAQKRNVATQGMKKEREFTIQIGAHIMSILSNMYANPADAMVREYLTNMYDAHVAFGKTPNNHPIPELHLPNMLQGELVFKDFGVGMSMDTVWEIYSMYGNSTKNESNAEVGGFGIGSKTAFAYNSGQPWTIESRFDGEVHNFMAFVNDKGIPSLSHVTTNPTTEPNGVTIKIPILRKDISEIYKAAGKYVPYFPIPLKVFGSKEVLPKKYLYEGKKWGIRDKVNYDYAKYCEYPWRDSTSTYGYDVCDIVIIMGNVPYLLNKSAISLEHNLSKFISATPVDLYMDIGSVDIVPSRDGLQYTDKTKHNIKKAIQTYITEFTQILNDEVTKCKTEWEAIQTAKKIEAFWKITNNSIKIQYNGKDVIWQNGINRTIEEIKAVDKNIEFEVFAIGSSEKARINSTVTNVDKGELKVGMYLDENLPNGSVGKTSWIVIDDMKTKGAKVAKSLIHNTLVNKTTNGRALKYGHTAGRMLFITQTTATKEELSALFGGLPLDYIKTTSELAPVVKISPSVSRKDQTIYKWGGKVWGGRIKLPTDTDIKYYLPLTECTSGRWKYEGREWHQAEAVEKHQDILSLIDPTFKLSSTLYGIRKTDLDKYDSAEWVDIEAFTIKKALEYVEKNKEAYFYRLNEIDYNITNSIKNIQNMKLGSHSELFKTLDDEYKLYQSKRTTYDGVNQSIYDYLSDFGEKRNKRDAIMKSVKITIPNFNNMIDNIHEKYPMLAFIDGYVDYTTKQRKNLKDYVEMVDKST